MTTNEFQLADDAREHDPLCQRRVPPVWHDHVWLPSLGECAQVHVHEGLSLGGLEHHLRHLVRVRVSVKVQAAEHHLLVDVQLERV